MECEKTNDCYFKHVTNFFESVANFLGIISIKAGDAESIYTALTDYLFNDLLIEKSRLVAFGSNGAAVMVGHTNRVAARLRQLFPALGNTHCLSVAQRLTLSLWGSSNHVMKVKFVLEWLDAVNRHYKKSFACLRNIQEALEISDVLLNQAVWTPWLSYDWCFKIQKVYPALILSLSRKASKRKGVEAHDFLLSLSKWDFISTIELLAEVLPRLGTLSKTLQV